MAWLRWLLPPRMGCASCGISPSRPRQRSVRKRESSLALGRTTERCICTWQTALRAGRQSLAGSYAASSCRPQLRWKNQSRLACRAGSVRVATLAPPRVTSTCGAIRPRGRSNPLVQDNTLLPASVSATTAPRSTTRSSPPRTACRWMILHTRLLGAALTLARGRAVRATTRSPLVSPLSARNTSAGRSMRENGHEPAKTPSISVSRAGGRSRGATRSGRRAKVGRHRTARSCARRWTCTSTIAPTACQCRMGTTHHQTTMLHTCAPISSSCLPNCRFSPQAETGLTIARLLQDCRATCVRAGLTALRGSCELLSQQRRGSC